MLDSNYKLEPIWLGSNPEHLLSTDIILNSMQPKYPAEANIVFVDLIDPSSQ